MTPPNSKLVATAVSMVRKVMHDHFDTIKHPLLSLGPRQKASRQDRGPSPSVWAIPVNIPAPVEDDACDAVLSAIAKLGDNETPSPSLQSGPVAAEWVGMRRGRSSAGIKSPKERLDALNTDTENPTTILFVHGGAYFQNGLGTSRPTAAKLSKESGGRVVVLDYRLAPQYAFPSQILDLFILYLSLLYPPPGSFHDPVHASSLVLAGESVGATIAMGLLQALLQLQNQTVVFHGQRVSVPLPAGITVVSCMGEHALCLPSWDGNEQFDVMNDQAPYLDPEFPADEIWPSDPPREDPYCEASFLHHPMVSPCTADIWKGAPPMWFGVGQERMADSSKVIAQAAYKDGVCVWWDQYEAMPHCWMLLMPKFPHSAHAFKRWGEACRKIVKGDDLESRGHWIEVEKLEEIDIDMKKLISLEPKDARKMIKAKAKRMKVFYGKRPSAHL